MIRAAFRIPSYTAAAAVMAAAAVHPSGAADIYVTGFNDYAVGNLSGQLAWIGVGGSWATTGSTNSPFVAGSILGAGTAPGVDPVGGTGRMARLCTERFASGRSLAYLDLANSGRWAAASAGGNPVLETTVSINVPAGQPVASAYGITVRRSAFEYSGGFVVSSQNGAVSLLNGGYLPANRVATSASVALGTWNTFTYRWKPSTGQGELLINGTSVATHVTSQTGSTVFTSSLLAATDAAPGTSNAFGYFDDLAIRAVPDAPPPCRPDLNGDGVVDGADLGLLLGAWGPCGGSPCAADQNSDGVVDGADLGLLLGAWGACP